MKITLTVAPVDGEPYDVATDLWVIVQWERKTRRKLADLSNGPGAEDLGVMAYYACRRAQIVVPASVDEFLQSIASIEVSGVAAANPTHGVTSDDS